MKIKNVSLIEQHIEKIFIGIALIVLLFVMWFYGLNTPNTAFIDGQLLKPSEIDPTIERRANALNQQINSNNIPQALEELKITDYTQLFFDRINQKLTTATNLPPLNPIADVGIDDNVLGRHKYVPVVPAPVIVAVQPDIAAISPIVVRDNDDLKKRFPPGTPFDISWISLVAHFDLIEMRKELLTPSTEEYYQIDRNWWEAQFAIVSYELQRQTAAPDGTFPEGNQGIEPVSDLPGQPRVSIPDSVTDGQEGVAYQQLIQLNQEALIRYPFYPLKGRNWEPPTAIIQGLDPQLIQEISLLYQAITKQIKDTLFIIKRRDSSPQNEIRYTPLIPPAVVKLTDLQREYWKITNTTVMIENESIELNLNYQGMFISERANEKMVQDEAERVIREAEFNERLRLDPNAIPFAEETATPTQTIGKIIIPPNGQADIWAHDINVKTGESYRYRMRIFVTNPLWKKDRNLPEDQRIQYAHRLQLESAWGAWSPPITIQPSQFVFLDNAQAAPTPIPGNVTVDVWKFWDGNWRNNTFKINPGDPIGSRATTDSLDVNYYDGANLVDINFQYRLNNRSTTRMVYTQNGQTLHRIQSLDRAAPMRDYLKTQKAISNNLVRPSAEQ